MKKFIALAILIVAIGSHVNYSVGIPPGIIKYGFELAEGFDIEFLYGIDPGSNKIDSMSTNVGYLAYISVPDHHRQRIIPGIKNEFVVVGTTYLNTADSIKGAIYWYKSEPQAIDSSPVKPKAIIKYVGDLSNPIKEIMPAGSNSFYMIVDYEDPANESIHPLHLLKVTGPFEPAGIIGSSLY